MSEIDHYEYQLPKELIAQEPLANRIDSRLMVVDREFETINHSHIRDIVQFLSPRDCLVFNDTRVIPAKLTGYRTKTRGRWHGLFLESDEQGIWKMLCKTRGKIKPGDTIVLQNRNGVDDIELVMLARLNGGAWAGKPKSDLSWKVLLDRVGRVPLPHYIRGGNMVDSDLKDYQTVFAKKPGAVAAPTAGLHFTGDLIREIKNHGTEVCSVTLHVGIGTFRPIKADRLEDHQMHSEFGEIKQDAVNKIKLCKLGGGRVIAIGTTSMRVLETAAGDGEIKPWTGETDLFIRPSYEFKIVDSLLTNFHLPRSTLLILVRTFGGDELMKRSYELAIEDKYRFFSYGDAMLIV